MRNHRPAENLPRPASLSPPDMPIWRLGGPPKALAQITARSQAAEAQYGRVPGSTRLIAVSKVQPLDRVVSVLEEGHRLLGENYVQETAGKWPDLRARFAGVQVHMIGPLQTNKAKQALELFDEIGRASCRERV